MPLDIPANSTNVRKPETRGNDTYQENTMRVIAVALAGWMLLLATVPAWARDGVLAFGAFYGLLVCLLDASVQSLVAAAWSRLRSGRAKRLAARRAAT